MDLRAQISEIARIDSLEAHARNGTSDTTKWVRVLLKIDVQTDRLVVLFVEKSRSLGLDSDDVCQFDCRSSERIVVA